MEDDHNLTCSICLELFDSKIRCPRMLSCGHTFCLKCLTALFKVKRSRDCSTCRKPIIYWSAAEIPINFLAKSMVESSVNKTSQDLCEIHNSLRNSECISCNIMICGVCGMLNHKHCEVNFVDTTLKTVKDKFVKETSTMKSDLQAYISRLTNEINQINGNKDSVVHLLQSLPLKIYALENDLNNKLKSMDKAQTSLSEFEESEEDAVNATIYQDYQNKTQKTRDIMDVIKSSFDFKGKGPNVKKTSGAANGKPQNQLTGLNMAPDLSMMPSFGTQTGKMHNPYPQGYAPQNHGHGGMYNEGGRMNVPSNMNVSSNMNVPSNMMSYGPMMGPSLPSGTNRQIPQTVATKSTINPHNANQSITKKIKLEEKENPFLAPGYDDIFDLLM